MIRCLIADDEVIARQILEQYVMQTEGLTLVGQARNAMEAFARMEQQQVDLMFLDIEMPLVNGVAFLKTLTAPPKVIFTTAYAEYAVQGFELNAVDYLLKPFSYQRFTQAVEKARQLISIANTPAQETREEKYLLLKEKEGLIKVAYEDVLYIEGSRDYMKIFTTSRQYLVHLTMKKLEEMLPPELFVRTHKSYIVSLRSIKIMKVNELVLMNQQTIPVSTNYKEQVLLRFKK